MVDFFDARLGGSVPLNFVSSGIRAILRHYEEGIFIEVRFSGMLSLHCGKSTSFDVDI
jgi:hypothetical protein